MPDETLIAAAEPDRFTHESPIRAFTDFRVAGTWAIGKGFRPSLAHLHTYLDAMQHKEGWHLVQMLDGGSLNPTLIFQRDRILSMTIPERPAVNTLEDVDAWLKDMGFSLVALPDGTIRYEPERKIGKHPALAAPYTGSDAVDTDAIALPAWMQHASDEPIPDEHYMACAEYVIGRSLNGTDKAQYVESTVREFKKRFAPPKNHACTSHTSLAQQLEFILGTNPVRIKQLIDGFREEHRLRFRDPYTEFATEIMRPGGRPTFVPDLPFDPKAVDRVVIPGEPEPVPYKQPNVGDDPINPAYYDGTACAEIIEHMPTNVGIAAKYGWRLGEKDEEVQECGKAAWYLKRELALHDETVDVGHGRAKFGFASPSDAAWYRRYADERIDAARTAGKLTPERALFMTHLVSYTITGHVSLLHQAIGFLESPACFSEYGRGMEP